MALTVWKPAGKSTVCTGVRLMPVCCARTGARKTGASATGATKAAMTSVFLNMGFPLLDDPMNRHAELDAVGIAVVVEMPADGACLLRTEISARPPRQLSGQAI